ncbi:AAA family ATPase [Thalassolituus sp. LLYu03]|uniref:AAA family ATPase n=1 Tax=Thalassolituus sp. LLYu03 TaxID=3421656 RepID=UPI003D288A8A
MSVVTPPPYNPGAPEAPAAAKAPADKNIQLLAQLLKSLGQVVQTDPGKLKLVLVCLLCKGHLLLEDAPGLGKTTLARSLSQLLAVRMKRLQCTPDLMPSDVTGISVYNSEEHKFHFMPGPVFTNILLADEINRATPRTQSALLEAMAEATVTADRTTYKLPNPFMVIATQNPVEFAGTFPLPEAQLDRFFMRLSLGYPDEAQEIAMMMAQLSGHPLDNLKPLLSESTILALQADVEKVTVSEALAKYIGQLVRETRNQPGVRLGASPRGSLALMRASRALAYLAGRSSVSPDIVRLLLEPVLGHRVVFRDATLSGDDRAEFWKQLIARVPVPDFAKTDGKGK